MDIIKTWEKAKQDVSAWHNHYDDLAHVFSPSRLGFSSTQPDGESRSDTLYDGSPQQAARGLTNTIDGLLWPDGELNYRVRVDNDALENSDEVKDWQFLAAEANNDEMNRPQARFRQARGEKTSDLVIFGTGCMFIGENRAKTSLRYQTMHLKNCTPIFDRDGTPIGNCVEEKLAIRDLIKMFPKAEWSDATKQKIAEEKYGDEIKMLHSVVPREEYSEGFLARNLPVADVWHELDAKKKIFEGGFHEFPFVIPRWDTKSGEKMGRSPGMLALPDANTLQAMGETLLIAGQRAADPPLAVPNDGAFSEYNTFPGGLVYYDIESAASIGGNPFFPLDGGGNMPITLEMQQNVREQVYMAFYRHIFNLPLERPEMTAYEVRARKEELIREIGPVMGRLESDDTAPTVERSFAVNLRAGRLPPIPKVLQGQRVGFEYESPVKKIREQAEAVEAAMWANAQFERAAIRPEAADLVNVDELGRFEHEAAGLPLRIIASKESIEALQQQRAEAQQAQAQQEMMMTGAKAANDAAGAIQKVVA